MISTIYLIILIYFLAGGFGFYYIGRKKYPELANKNRIKLFIYFIIVNVLFFSIILYPFVFRILAGLIILAGLYELLSVSMASGYRDCCFLACSLLIYALTAIGFFLFTNLDKYLILYSFLIISIFDSFSQITGQIWGRRKLIPAISPKKTVEGLIGGILITFLSIVSLRPLISLSIAEAIFLTAGTLIFAFTGDIAASYYKRKFNVKDFSNLIPGHGGFLDRFDSLIAGGAWVALFGYITNL